jgi:TPR repeat protein
MNRWRLRAASLWACAALFAPALALADPGDDLRWLRTSAEAGDADGAFRLGEMYEFGRGVDKDERAALAWYLKAAAQGDEMAKSNLGVLDAD